MVIVVFSTSFTNKIVSSVPVGEPAADAYTSMHLQDSGLSHEAFNYAILGFQALKQNGSLQNDSILTIIDFTEPSSEKRLFVINLNSQQILFKTYVSHGKNSGVTTADAFSNKVHSNKSSLGFYITSDTYRGKHGYSLRLVGQEKGINDNALARGIVMHCADYVNEKLIRSQGYIGRSEGCPAIPKAVHVAIIDQIKNGSCLFIFGNDQKYFSASDLIPHFQLIKIQA